MTITLSLWWLIIGGFLLAGIVGAALCMAQEKPDQSGWWSAPDMRGAMALLSIVVSLLLALAVRGVCAMFWS